MKKFSFCFPGFMYLRTEVCHWCLISCTYSYSLIDKFHLSASHLTTNSIVITCSSTATTISMKLLTWLRSDMECLCVALGSLLVLLSHSNKGRLILFSLYLRSGPEYYLLRCRQMVTDNMGFSVSTMQSKGPCDLECLQWFGSFENFLFLSHASTKGDTTPP